MASKTNKTPAATTPAPKGKAVATFPTPPDKEKTDALAKMAMRPSVNAAAVLTEYARPMFGEQDVGSLVDGLYEGIEDLWQGDMKRAEAMLYSQAYALQSIFSNLARRATKQEYLKQWEAYLRMALKAQNQCRMTLETLATLKNPPVIIAKQANINQGGQQQVNNGVQALPASSLASATVTEVPDADSTLNTPVPQALPAPTPGMTFTAAADRQAEPVRAREKSGK